MKSVKELNKVADAATKSVRKVIDAVVDEQSFIESDRFVRSETDLGSATGEGVVSGLATVLDRNVALFAVNGDVLKGSIGKANSAKIVKCVRNAVKSSMPLIGIVDTMGARFAEGLDALEGYADILHSFSEAAGETLTVLVVKGSNFGSLSYLTGIADFTILYDKSVTVTSSPLILAAKAGKDSAKVGTASVLAEAGIASLVVKSDEELGAAVRNILTAVGDDVLATDDDGNRTCPDLSAKSKMRDIVSSVIDNGSMFELKKDYGKEAITGFARLNGISVGVVATDAKVAGGKLTPAGIRKITSLLYLCDDFGLPVVTFADCTGVAECAQCQPDLMTATARLLGELSSLSTAKISVICGKATGLGYIAFASKKYYDYTIAWDKASIGMMDDLASAELVYADRIAKAPDRDKAAKKLAKEYGEENTSAVVVAQGGYIDNVISPELTRPYLVGAVQAFINKR